MDAYDETRTLRRRLQEVEDAARQDDVASTSQTFVGRTTTITTYPTAAQAYYAVNAVRVTGPLGEGLTPTLTAGTTTSLALNVGTGIPPAGTYVVVGGAAGRQTFRWDS